MSLLQHHAPWLGFKKINPKTPDALKKRNVLIFDLGSGTFDVSILNIQDGIFEGKSTAGDTHLSGENFDNCMVNHLVDDFKCKRKKHTASNKQAMCRTEAACKKAKCILNFFAHPGLEIDWFYKGVDFYPSISWAHFEQLSAYLLRGTLKHVQKSLKDAQFDKSQVNGTVLVGDSTCIPKFQKLLKDVLNGEELNKTTHHDEATACGAAAQAALLTGNKSEHVQRSPLMLPLSQQALRQQGGCDIPYQEKHLNASKADPDVPSLPWQQDHCLSKSVWGRKGFNEKKLLGKFVLSGIL